MSIDSAKAFYADVTSGQLVLDPSKFASDNRSEKLAYIQSFGYDFNADEILEVIKENGHSVTLEEADQVVGGSAGTGGTLTASGVVVAVGVVGAAVAAA